MKLSPRPSRASVNLSESIQHQLSMYALAASAAGVGIMALAQPAQARIVYTHAHQAVGKGLTLDLNHDGIGDFKIQPFTCCTDVEYFLLAFSLGSSNRVFGAATENLPPASDLPWGYRVGPNSVKFQKGFTFTGQTRPAKVLFVCTNSAGTVNCGGPWLEGSRSSGGYLGFRFLIKGKIHYGWARITVASANPPFILTGYAYETIPNKAITAGQTKGRDDPTIVPDSAVPDDLDTGASLISPISDTPQPASLGMLAFGSQGVPLWRRKEALEVTG
jgi:hypothetical protein